MKKLNIYWSRRDFRLTDNLALSTCLEKSKEENSFFLPVFILEDYMRNAETKYQFGYLSRYFLAKALPKYSEKFKKFFVLKGKAADTLINISKKLEKEFEIEIFVNEDVYIDFYKQIKKIKSHNIKINVFVDQITVDKNTKSGTGNFYSIFTPFKKSVWSEFLNSKESKKIKEGDLRDLNYLDLEEISTFKSKIVENDFKSIFSQFSKNRKFEIKIKNKIEIIDIDELLDFKPDFENLDNFYFTEEEAIKRFDKYLKTEISNYKENRDSLEKDKTSKVSLGLAFGLVSARTLKSKIQNHFKYDFLNALNLLNDEKYSGPIHFISELIWREFYKYLFYHNPNLMHQEFQEKFRNKIKWTD